MKIEKTHGTLRAVAENLFGFIEGLSSSKPEVSGQSANADLYKGVVLQTGTAFDWLRFVERGGSKNPPLSVDLHTEWSEAFGDSGLLKHAKVTQGNDWFGTEKSTNLTILVEVPEQIDDAKTFIRLAFKCFTESGEKHG